MIMNSDQGSHFTCQAYIDLLKATETVKISMNGKGRATDNAITERFIRNLKQEKLYREEIHDGKDAYSLINEYIHEYSGDFEPLNPMHRATCYDDESHPLKNIIPT